MSKTTDKNQTVRLVFDASARDFVLEAFGKAVDDEGYVVEKSNPMQRVFTIDGQEIKKEKFAGVRKGSEIYIKSDVVSLIEMCDDIRGRKRTDGSTAMVREP